MKVDILSTGEELVLGATVDTNSAWLSVRLSQMGLPVGRHVAVGDDQADIVRELRESCGRADVVIMTGGLGPTADDLTRAALAELVGQPLVTCPASLEQITARFARMGRVMPPENAVQALHPQGSRPLRNDHGTAPGIHAVATGPTGRRTDVLAVPGVPREMMPMFDEHIRPFLSERIAAAAGGAGGAANTAAGRVMAIRMINCFGIGESVIGEAIKPLMARGRNPSVGTNVKDAIIRVRVNYTGSGSPAEANAAAAADVAEIRRRLTALGDVVFGEDDVTLAEAAVARLRSTGRTVSVIEGMTGGLLAAALTEVPGVSAHFRDGAVVYSNAAKVRLGDVSESLIARSGSVSPECAEALAAGWRVRSGADVSLSIVGLAGPSGATADKPIGLCYIGLADAVGVTHQRLTLLGERDQIRDRAVKHALNALRLRLA